MREKRFEIDERLANKIKSRIKKMKKLELTEDEMSFVNGGACPNLCRGICMISCSMYCSPSCMDTCTETCTSMCGANCVMSCIVYNAWQG